mmetsp:Transcript_13635/g.25731  ORF Transcript_13635/g.25731 Transcript_13635/m.25731 type:complete len:354 (+) Transcript_13635:137-1198(+)
MTKSLVVILFLPYAAWAFQYLSATVHSQDVPSAPVRELWHPHIYTAQKADDSRIELRHGAQFYETTLSFMQMTDEEESETKSCRCRFVKQTSSSSSGFLQTSKGKQSSEILIQSKEASQNKVQSKSVKVEPVLLQETAAPVQRQQTFVQEPAFVQQSSQTRTQTQQPMLLQEPGYYPQQQPILMQEPAYYPQQQPVLLQEPAHYQQQQPVLLQEPGYYTQQSKGQESYYVQQPVLIQEQQQPMHVQQYAQQPVYLQEPMPQYSPSPVYIQQPQYQPSPQLIQQPQHPAQVFVQYPEYTNNYYQPQRTMEPQPYVLLQEPQRERVEYIEVPRQELLEVPGYMRVQPMYVEASRY